MTTLYDEIVKAGVDVNKHKERVHNAFKELKRVELDYFAAMELVVKKLHEENDQLKDELRRVKEDKEENEAAYERIITNYRKKLGLSTSDNLYERRFGEDA